MMMTATAPIVRGQQSPPPKRSTPPPPPPAPSVISSRQIDRYDAINALQQRLKENPKSVADWVILGELAHEVALDLPADQATRYYRLSRDAYEKALALQPDNLGLKAAVQFARDHETNAQRFEEARDRAAQTYLEARRRDLAASRYTPSLPVYGVPQTAPPPTTTATVTTSVPPIVGKSPTAKPGIDTSPTAPPTSPAAGALPDNVRTNPGRAAAAAIVAADRDPVIEPAPRAQADTANYGARQFFSSSIPPYQPYYVEGVPFTYQQYTSSYYPANLNNTPTPPITAQRYYTRPGLPNQPTAPNPLP
jgi:hypothetical protein